MPFPGPGCFTDYDSARGRGRPNWVGHFITTYAPEPRYRDITSIQENYPGYAQEQDPAYERDPLLVYDYARGGKTIPDVISQIEDQFLPRLGQWHRPQPAEGAGQGGDAAKVWTSANALFRAAVIRAEARRGACPHDLIAEWRHDENRRLASPRVWCG